MNSGKNLEDMKHVVAGRSIKLNNHLKKLFCIFYAYLWPSNVTLSYNKREMSTYVNK